MLRYLYPLIVLGFVMVFCGLTPLRFPADSALGPILMVSSAVGMTIVWPLFIGNRLHELSCRKLADQLHLAYTPYGTGTGKYKSAQVEGTYYGRDLRLGTLRKISGLRRQLPRTAARVDYYMSLKVRVNALAHFRMEIRDKRVSVHPRLADMTKTGNARFDRRLVFFYRPDFMVDVLAATNLADQLAQIVRPGRRTTITLRNGELLFEERSRRQPILWRTPSRIGKSHQPRNPPPAAERS